MGNGSSSVGGVGCNAAAADLLEKITLDEDPIVQSAGWNLHHGFDNESDAHLSVYVSKPETEASKNFDVVEECAKNLKVYRHPCILRYVNSCQDGAAVSYLVTEKTSPLHVVLAQQSDLQVRLGLYDVIGALRFLHDKADVVHNNVCQASIQVAASDGRWRLGGMQFARKVELINLSFLETTRPLRHENGVAPEEKNGAKFKDHKDRDVYSLGLLVKEVLIQDNRDADTQSLLELAETRMLAEDPTRRPALSDLLAHPFFDQSYLKIVDFLSNLALKSGPEKTEFFGSITRLLFDLPEKVVASQLTAMLLSRLVLLESDAGIELIPSLLQPAGSKRKNGYDPNSAENPLLNDALHKEFVVPHLTKIFTVRDFHIRMVLLRHFKLYYKSFSQSALELEILPLLLLGIRDSDNEIVSWTLRALAEIVPVLGASTVVGKNRLKVFSDCSPSKERMTPSPTNSPLKTAPLNPPPMTSSVIAPSFESSSLPDVLAERCSPIGAENSDSAGDSEQSENEGGGWDSWDQEAPSTGKEGQDFALARKDDAIVSHPVLNNTGVEEKRHVIDSWENWEQTTSASKEERHDFEGKEGSSPFVANTSESREGQSVIMEAILPAPNDAMNATLEDQMEAGAVAISSSKVATLAKGHSRLQLDVDLDQLDIKAKKTSNPPKTTNSFEDDFFADMEPVITKGKNLLELLEENQAEDGKQDAGKQLKFDVTEEDCDDEDGWGDDWNDDDDELDLEK